MSFSLSLFPSHDHQQRDGKSKTKKNDEEKTDDDDWDDSDGTFPGVVPCVAMVVGVVPGIGLVL